MRDWVQSISSSDAARPQSGTADRLSALQAAVEAVIRGKPDTVKTAIVALIAGGHLLIEDVPGIGKTTLANAIARAIGLQFQRIQFTSDLLPSDVIGLSVYDRRTSTFEWKPGPIFANIVLADEINRATPKTQSALLEAMAEEQVTVEGVTRPLPSPFMVIATQNPSEHHGTYPLPESQLDRFMLRLHIGYPSAEDEKAILRDRETSDPLDEIEPVMSGDELADVQRQVGSVRMHDDLLDYLISLVDATRRSEHLELGISPRGALALYRVAQANALVEGRHYCIADDIKRLAVPCFAHRVIVSSRISGGRQRTREAERILEEILAATAVPI
jgi:MoxR-like ATPase